MTIRQTQNKISSFDAQEYRGQLLDWYDRHERDVPWRVGRGEEADAYKVWLSEIMCQQTTVAAVIPYYTKFLSVWPTVKDLARADEADVMAAWAGLGYYARARNLHKCAKIVANDLGGVFPDTQEALKALPGIGEYTSAAIAAIAFGRNATVVDGNVERVVARFFAVEEPLPKSKPALKSLASLFFEDEYDRPGDLAQAFMDLGARVCIPKTPRCMLCPLREVCAGQRLGIANALPKKEARKPRPQKYAHMYWVMNDQGQVLFEKRPETGLLGGMIGLPTSEWIISQPSHNHAFEVVTSISEKSYHTFTHFDLESSLHVARYDGSLDANYFWQYPEEKHDSLPSVFKKVFRIFTSVAP